MASFLLLVEKIIDYSKKDIDKGNTPPKIYQLCSCIRETFCISYTIRKGHTLYLLFEEDLIIIKFDGSKLRFLGPDERSQALLLGKAIYKSKQINIERYERWIESTPGISAIKFSDIKSLIYYSTILFQGDSYYIIEEPSILEVPSLNITDVKRLDDNFYIIPTYSLKSRNSFVIQLAKELEPIKLIDLSKIKVLEDKILYINFRIDQLSKSS